MKTVVLYDPYPPDGGGAGLMPSSLLARCLELDGLVMPLEEAIDSIREAAELLVGEVVDERMPPVERVKVSDHGDYICAALLCGKPDKKYGDLIVPGPRFMALRYIEGAAQCT